MALGDIEAGLLQISQPAQWFVTYKEEILGLGQLAWLDDDSGTFKKGDGIRTIENLPWLGGGGDAVESVIGTADRIVIDNTDPFNPIINIASEYDTAIANAISQAEQAANDYTDSGLSGKEDSLGFTPENVANKDASGGYVGLTLLKINFKNVLNTFTSFFTNSNTASRTYTFRDRDGTIADQTAIEDAINLTIRDCGTFDFSGNTFPATGGTGTAGAIQAGNLFSASVSGAPGGVTITAPYGTATARVDNPGQALANWRIQSAGDVPKGSGVQDIVFPGKWTSAASSGVRLSSGGLSNTTTYYHPLFISVDRVFTQIGYTALGSPGTVNGRCAIYENNPSTMLPSTLVVDSGNISTGGSAGFKSIAFASPITLLASHKLYWLAFRVSSNGISFVAHTAINVNIPPSIALSGMLLLETAAFGAYAGTANAAYFTSSSCVTVYLLNPT